MTELRASHADRDRVVEILRIDGLGGDTQRSGTWVVPRAMEINVVGGSVKLDFAQAVISQPTLRIRVMVRGGLPAAGDTPD